MKRKGFTLVELLIVIVVIGILSAMMMMSSTEATTSAKVNNIISDMRNLKTAALSFYADNFDEIVGNPNYSLKKDVNKEVQDKIFAYLGKDSNRLDKDNYKVSNAANGGGDGSWWVVCNITGSASEKALIKKKLAGRAKSLGLKGVANYEAQLSTATDFDAAKHGAVVLKVR